MVKRRRMTAKQLKYFGPRRTRTKRKVVNIARYRRTRRYARRAYGAARRGYSRRKGLLGGSMGNVLWGAAAGVAAPMIPQILGTWTNPVVFGAGGYLLKKPALLTIAGYEAGKSLGGMFFGNGIGTTTEGWL